MSRYLRAMTAAMILSSGEEPPTRWLMMIGEVAGSSSSR
jgi:hypothetical protein